MYESLDQLVLWYPFSPVAALWFVASFPSSFLAEALSPAWWMRFLSPLRWDEGIRRASKQLGTQESVTCKHPPSTLVWAKRPSTCSLLDKQHVHVIYGGMIYDWRMYEYYRSVWYWEMSALYWMKILRWCAVRMSVTPLETCLLWYVWFWVDSDGIRPLYQSSFGHLVNLDSYVLD